MTERDRGTLLDGARLIVRNGRAWIELTEEDVERGARAVVSDPTYRDELTRCALRHVDEEDDIDLAARILRAHTALQLNDLHQRKRP